MNAAHVVTYVNTIPAMHQTIVRDHDHDQSCVLGQVTDLKAWNRMALIPYSRHIDLKELTVVAYKESVEWLRDYITAIKQGKFHPFTKLERKAREATRNEPW